MGEQEHSSLQKEPIQRRKNLLIVGAVAVAILAIASFFAIKNYIDAPRDLGSDLVYIGKEDYGCSLLDLFSLCDSPSSGYYYYFGTSMSSDQIKQHLSKAGYVYDENKSGYSYNGGYDYTALTFKPNKYSPEGLYLQYYDARSSAFEDSSTHTSSIHTNKQYVIQLDDRNYLELRQALQDAHLLGQ